MSNLAQIAIEIARLRIGSVAGAYNKYCNAPVPGISKSDASQWLAQAVVAGHITMDDIRNAPVGSFAQGDPAIGAKIDATASAIPVACVPCSPAQRIKALPPKETPTAHNGPTCRAFMCCKTQSISCQSPE